MCQTSLMIDQPDWDSADPDSSEPSCDWTGNIYVWLGTFSHIAAARAYFTESLPNSDAQGSNVSPFMRDYSLRTSPHYFRESGHLQWDLAEPDLFRQMKELKYGAVFGDAAKQIIEEDNPSPGARVLVVLYESDLGEHNAFQPRRPACETPLTFVGCFCIDGELVEVLDALS